MQAEGNKGGSELAQEIQQIQACRAGRRDEQLALASLILAKIYRTRAPELENANIWRITWGVLGRDTKKRKDLKRVKPSSLYHDCSMRKLHQILAITPTLHLPTRMVS